ncbi:hypothetical protein H6G36_03825 [Anabaena minutissima FACHB-250]|nr:hypothetical protein [Anabaena minutissima FACHB-250]
MANIISLADYQEFWRERNQNTRQPDPSDPSDIINICPQQFGSGYERWIELRDISLLIIDAEFHHDLVIERKYSDSFSGGLEFGFHLSGYSGRPHHVNKQSLFSIELKIMSLTPAYCEGFRRWSTTDRRSSL